MAMKVEEYKKIKEFISNHKGLTRNCSRKLIHKFSHIPAETLRSILALHWRYRVNKFSVAYVSKQITEQYNIALKENEPPGILVRLSVNYQLPPTTIARVILEDYVNRSETVESGTLIKTKVNKLLKDTTLINDMDLAYEVYLCVLNDDQFGTISDVIKSSIGLEYEQKLIRIAKRNNLAFKDEEHLRKDGYDKTPDIKLDIPVAINGFIISWIESKALFGHPKVHDGYDKEQYTSYWNRFGPGLIIYWFGYLETIINPSEKRFIILDKFPENIVHLDPKNIDVNFTKFNTN